MSGQERPVHPRRQAALHRQVAWGKTRRRNSLHDDPVKQQQGHRDNRLRTQPRLEVDDRCEEITERDPLQHAGDTQLRQCHPLIRNRIQDQADDKDQRRSSQDFKIEVMQAASARDSLLKCQWNGHADDEDEEGEDQIGRSPTIPFGMLQRRIDGVPTARIVDQNHAGDRQSAKDVQRKQPASKHRFRFTLICHVTFPSFVNLVGMICHFNSIANRGGGFEHRTCELFPPNCI